MSLEFVIWDRTETECEVEEKNNYPTAAKVNFRLA